MPTWGLLAGTAVVAAAIPRDPHAQLERMPDHRDIADTALDVVAEDPRDPAAGTAPRPLDDQVGEHHRRLARDRGVGHPDSELDGPDDRVGHDLGRQGRRLRHRVPGTLKATGVGTVIINFSGPALPQRHDPSPPVDHTLSCTPFPEEPLKDAAGCEAGRSTRSAGPLHIRALHCAAGAEHSTPRHGRVMEAVRTR